MRVVISCGPIPARLDSVKFITNRFKGGLAFKTAAFLADQNYELTIVKWRHTPIPEELPKKNAQIVSVEDVFEYYEWFEDHATEYDAFVMAGAVANLTPKEPFEGKFPSHNYKQGDSIPIEFMIAPRAIDIVKQKNPRCCLIGYKLFDADPTELIEIGQRTLLESKANVIFANTPESAAREKIALMQDGTVAFVDFQKHLQLMKIAIEAKYFRTEVKPILRSELMDKNVRNALALTEMFDKTFPGHGSVAIPVIRTDLVATTARGHQGEPVLIRAVDFKERVIYATGKASLNAPAMFLALTKIRSRAEESESSYKILVHRHLDDPKNPNFDDIKTIPYVFPGTLQEAETIGNQAEQGKPLRIEGHGDIYFRDIDCVNWDSYYENFPDKYFKTPEQMQKVIAKYRGKETLEVGGNRFVSAKYAFDQFVKADNAINLEDMCDIAKHHFDLIIARNSINYMDKSMIAELLSLTDRFIANTFLVPPIKKVTECEAAVFHEGTIQHFLLLKDDNVQQHKFFAYTQKDYEELGFRITPYGGNSALLEYRRS